MVKKTIKCPNCDGNGWYDYHWQECGNSQIDEWIKEDCSECNKTGLIPYIKKKNAVKKNTRTQKDPQALVEALRQIVMTCTHPRMIDDMDDIEAVAAMALKEWGDEPPPCNKCEDGNKFCKCQYDEYKCL